MARSSIDGSPQDNAPAASARPAIGRAETPRFLGSLPRGGFGQRRGLGLADADLARRVVLLEGDEALLELRVIVEGLVQDLAVDRDLDRRDDLAPVVDVLALDLLREELVGLVGGLV